MAATSHDLIALRALAALLTYPNAELRAALPEIGAVLAASALVAVTDRARLVALIAEMRASEPLELEARYVELFDHGRATSLHLFEHVHGQSRERGQAMVDLKARYAAGGLRLDAHELPDYLPVVLEYLSQCTLDEARALLGDCAPILRTLGEALVARRSGYAAVFAALLAIAGQHGLDWNKSAVAARESFDEDWNEAPAFEATTSVAHAPVRFMPRRSAEDVRPPVRET